MIRLFIASFLFVLASCLTAAAQGRVIDEATYNSEISGAGAYRSTENYRAKKTTKTVNGPPDTFDILEFDHPDKQRLTVFRLDKSQTDPTFEWIIIGKRKYTKSEGSNWKVEERAEAFDTRPSASGVRPQKSDEGTKLEFRDLGFEPGSSVRALQRTKRSQETVNGKSVELIQIVRTWIDRSGRLIKEEYAAGSTVITIVYEADPTIKIEAPIIQ